MTAEHNGETGLASSGFVSDRNLRVPPEVSSGWGLWVRPGMFCLVAISESAQKKMK